MSEPDDAHAPEDPARPSLNRQRVLRAAVALADREGLDALTMRRLAQEVGVEAMSLYHHVPNKGAVLDGALEVVLEEINAAVEGTTADVDASTWRSAVRQRVLRAREVLLRHPWAPRVLETRTSISLEVVTYVDGLLGILVAGGFTYDLAHHAMHALGSRAFGFTQELFEPDDPAAADEDAEAMLAALGERFPHVVAMVAEVAHSEAGQLGWCDGQVEFEFGLDVVLDGLDRLRPTA